MNYPKISVVIGTFNRLELLKLCIRSVRNELNNISHEIIVVDGGSDDDTIEWLTKQKDIVSIIQHNRGSWMGEKIEKKPWAYFMGLGFKCAIGEYVCMLSDDSLILPNAIINGLRNIERARNSGRKIGAICFYFRDYPIRKKYAVAINVGNLYLNHGIYLNQALKDVDYIDTDYHFYFADTDLALKIKQKGYECIASENSFVEHYFEATPEIRASNNDFKKDADRNRLINKWSGVAYPAEDKAKYQRNVGRWQNHPEGYSDQYGMIKQLILASHPELSIFSPMISVVIVVKNNREGLIKTLNSVKSEIYPLKEVVIIDGDSSDGTKDVIKKNSDFIDISVSEKDDGIYDAMNKGISLSNGEYIIFLNSGDEFSSNSAVYDVFSTKEPYEGMDVIYGAHYYFNENNEKEYRPANKITTIINKMPFNHQSAFYKRETLVKYPYNKSLKYCSDYEHLVRLLQAKCNFLHVPNVIANFYSGGLSESGEAPLREIVEVQLKLFGEKRVKDNSVYYKQWIESQKK